MQTYRGQLRNACPGDIKLLKEHTSRVAEETTQMKIDDASEECETQLGMAIVHYILFITQQHLKVLSFLDRTDSMVEPQKLKVWDEYKKLLQSAQPTKREQLSFQSLLTEITCLPKVPVNRYLFVIG